MFSEAAYMIGMLRRINRESGVTLLVTSHDMDDLRDMADRLVLVHRGQIRYDGGFDALSDPDERFESTIAEMYRDWKDEGEGAV